MNVLERLGDIVILVGGGTTIFSKVEELVNDILVEAQKEIGSLREEVERLQAVIDEANSQKPVAWITDDYLTDKSATTYSKEVAVRWEKKGWPVDCLYSKPVPVMPSQQSPAVADVVEAVADFVEKQEGGPYMPQVISAAILGQLMYGDTFKNIPFAFDGVKSPRITEQDAREIATDFDSWNCGQNHLGNYSEWYEKEGRTLLNKLNTRGE